MRSMQPYMGELEYVGMEEIEDATIVQLLLQDRVRLIRVVQRLRAGHVVEGEDEEVLKGLEAVLKGSPSREVLASLDVLGERNARLLTLIVAYAIYQVREN